MTNPEIPEDAIVAAAGVLVAHPFDLPQVGPDSKTRLSETATRRAMTIAEDALAAALPHLRVQEAASKCLDCEHTHTADGCIGEPSPSDVWAGVTPSICDCPSLRVQETPAVQLADDARVIATRLHIDSESIDREDTRIAVQNSARDVTRLAELIEAPHPRPVVDREAPTYSQIKDAIRTGLGGVSEEGCGCESHICSAADAVLALLPTEEGEGS